MGLAPLYMDVAGAADAERLRLEGNELFKCVLVLSIQQPPRVVSRAPRIRLFVRDESCGQSRCLGGSLAETSFSG
eukprot:964142-Prorocentrum_minimum.AAC.4